MDSCERNEDGEIVDPLIGDPIPEDKVITIVEGNATYCFNIEILYINLILNDADYNPYTRTKYDDDVLVKIEDYGESKRKIMRIGSDNVSIEWFFTLGDVIVEIFRSLDDLDTILSYTPSIVNLTENLYNYKLDTPISKLVPGGEFSTAISNGVSKKDLKSLYDYIKKYNRYEDITHFMEQYLGDQPLISKVSDKYRVYVKGKYRVYNEIMYIKCSDANPNIYVFDTEEVLRFNTIAPELGYTHRDYVSYGKFLSGELNIATIDLWNYNCAKVIISLIVNLPYDDTIDRDLIVFNVYMNKNREKRIDNIIETKKKEIDELLSGKRGSVGIENIRPLLNEILKYVPYNYTYNTTDYRRIVNDVTYKALNRPKISDLLMAGRFGKMYYDHDSMLLINLRDLISHIISKDERDQVGIDMVRDSVDTISYASTKRLIDIINAFHRHNNENTRAIIEILLSSHFRDAIYNLSTTKHDVLYTTLSSLTKIHDIPLIQEMLKNLKDNGSIDYHKL